MRTGLFIGVRALARPALLAVLAASTTVLHLGLHRAPGVWTEPVSLQQPQIFRRLGLAQETTIADIQFLHMVQYLGMDSAQAQGFPDLFALAQLVTETDPLYGYAYEVSAIALADPGHRLEESNLILEKGMANVPERWQLPFFAAFNKWYGLGDYLGAAPLLLRASQLPGSPNYLADLAARLISESGEIETGLKLIDAMLAQQISPQTRGDLEARRRDLIVERELRAIDAAGARFAAREGRAPHDLEELRETEHLVLPGFDVEYDSVSGTATSRLLPRRIRLHHPDPAPPLSGQGLP